MDSITKLRGKLAEAEDILQYVSKELEGYSTKDAEEHLNFAELKLRGEQYSFYEHPLTGKPFRDDYLALMIYLISLGGKKEEGWTVLYRIAAGCDYQGELQNLTTDAMTFTEERLSDLIREIYSAELANTFAIDSLMISHHMGADDAQLKFLAGVYELLKLDKGFLTEAMEFVKVLDATYWDNPAGKSKPWTILTAKDIATYIGGTPAESFSEAANLKKNRVIILNAAHTGSSVLLLDDWKPNEILFLNCRFENCGGIYSANKVVKFLSCSFDQSNFKRRKWNPSYPSEPSYFSSKHEWTNKEYSKYKELYRFENASFVNCIFKHFNDATPFLYLGRGLIHSCTFEDIRQYPEPCVMFTVNNAHVSNCRFTSCLNSIHDFNLYSWTIDNIHRYTSCMIYSTNTIWKENRFVNCSNNFNREYSYSITSYVLLLDKESHCNDCSFDNVTTIIKIAHNSYSRGKYWEDLAETSIIGLHDSSANNNEGATVSNVYEIDFKAGK